MTRFENEISATLSKADFLVQNVSFQLSAVTRLQNYSPEPAHCGCREEVWLKIKKLEQGIYPDET